MLRIAFLRSRRRTFVNHPGYLYATGFLSWSANGCAKNLVRACYLASYPHSFFLFWLIFPGAHFTCKHFVWVAWQNTAYHHKVVLIGTDKHMPCQPGAMWASRTASLPGLKQNHYLNLLKRIPSPHNKGKGQDAHFALEDGSLPLRIITLVELSQICPGTFTLIFALTHIIAYFLVL